MSETTLAQLQRQLDSPDFIMEPNAISSLTRFLKAGGTPMQVVQLLSGGYRGTDDMCNLVSSWIEIADPAGGSTTTERIVDEHLRQLALQRFDRQSADSIFGANAGATPDWLQAMVEHPAHRQLIYDLAEKHEQSLLLHFAIKVRFLIQVAYF